MSARDAAAATHGGGAARFTVDPVRVHAVVFAGEVLVVTPVGAAGRWRGPPGAPGAAGLLRSLRGAGIRTANTKVRRDAASLLASAGFRRGRLAPPQAPAADRHSLRDAAPDGALPGR